MTNDKQLEDEYTAARQQVETVKNEYEQTQNEQKQTKVELDAKKADLETQIEQANQVIAEPRKQHRSLLSCRTRPRSTQEAAIRSQIDQKAAALDAQQKAAAEAAKNNGTSYTVTNGTGQFTWPVPSSHTISSTFRLPRPPDLRYNEAPLRHRHFRELRLDDRRRGLRHGPYRDLQLLIRQLCRHQPRQRYLDALRSHEQAWLLRRPVRVRRARPSAMSVPPAFPLVRTATLRSVSTATLLIRRPISKSCKSAQ